MVKGPHMVRGHVLTGHDLLDLMIHMVPRLFSLSLSLFGSGSFTFPSLFSLSLIPSLTPFYLLLIMALHIDWMIAVLLIQEFQCAIKHLDDVLEGLLVWIRGQLKRTGSDQTLYCPP